MNRKQRRAAEAKRKKGDSNQAMQDKLMLFGHLPESCSACDAPFDKTNRDMVFSWKVVVREKEELRGIENLLSRPDKLSPARIRELEDRKKELENIIK